MTRKIKPIKLNPIGSFYNFPHWRFLIYQSPDRANLSYCVRKPIDGANCLRRYMAVSEDIRKNSIVNKSLTSEFGNIVNSLTPKAKTLFFRLFKKHLKKRGDTEVFCECYRDEKVKLWNAKFIDKILDIPLKEFLLHVAKIKYNPYYDFAVRMNIDESQKNTYCAIGYCIYAGLSDGEIAKRFKKYPGQIKAMRELFFDFSKAPVDPIARAAYFTQLADNTFISDTERRFYKLAAELGELGLRATADLHSLNDEERNKLKAYLGTSMLDNVMSLNFSVNSMQDALAYNGVINSLASFYIKQEEVAYYAAKVRNLDAATNRINNTKLDYDSSMDDEDRMAVELINQLALQEKSTNEHRAITELK